MKLSDALKFSYQRKALHPTKIGSVDGPSILASDFGIEFGSGQICFTTAWTELEPEIRKSFMISEGWTPLEPKPAMVILAESIDDWSIYEKDEQ